VDSVGKTCSSMRYADNKHVDCVPLRCYTWIVVTGTVQQCRRAQYWCLALLSLMSHTQLYLPCSGCSRRSIPHKPTLCTIFPVCQLRCFMPLCSVVCCLLLPQCPVFCQPQLAPESAALSPGSHGHSPDLSPSNGTDQLSTLPDVAAAATGRPAVPQASLPAAAAIAAGPCNTLVATRAGRVLVCGASSSGQCGSAWAKAAVCPGFVNVGPEFSWHGLLRPSANRVAAAGGQVADALAKVRSRSRIDLLYLQETGTRLSAGQ
jgi:hypothetical protein